jgi:hypothetical protein
MRVFTNIYYRRAVSLAFISIVLTLIVAGCGGGGTSSGMPSSGDSQSLAGALPWPPAESNAHAVSATQQVFGSNFTERSGNSTVKNTNLTLHTSSTEAPMSWAYFTVVGFLPGAKLSSITLDTTLTPAPAPGTKVFYIGLSNYTKQAWEWHEARWGAFTLPASSVKNYISPNGTTTVALCTWNCPGPLVIHSLSLDSSGGTIDPPANIVATPSVGKVSLTWDEAAGATGYYIERATTPSFASFLRLNESSLAAVAYDDTAVGAKQVYFYRIISATGPSESAPSATVSAFTPQVDLPAPGDLVVSNIGGTSFTVSWSWEGEAPDYFNLYANKTPGEQLGINDINIPGFISTYNLTDLEMGETVYLRLIASVGGSLGRSTEEIAVTTKKPWTWGTPVTIDAGTGPVAITNSPTETVVVYNNDSGVTAASSATGSTWTTSLAASGKSAESYIDIAYSSAGKYCVAFHTYKSDDVGGAIGSPGGGWNYALIDGDGASGQGHGVSGMLCDVDASDTEFSVVQYSSEAYGWKLHTSSATSPSWSGSVIAPDTLQSTGALGYRNGVPYFFYYDSLNHQLLVSNRDSGWSFSPALEVSGNYIGDALKVSYLDGNWMIPAIDKSAKKVYLLSGTTPPLDAEYIGKMDVIGVFLTPLIMNAGFKGFGGFRSNLGWQLVNEDDGIWNCQDIEVQGATLGVDLALGFMNGVPCIVFADSDGNIKCSVGIPPA